MSSPNTDPRPPLAHPFLTGRLGPGMAERATGQVTGMIFLQGGGLTQRQIDAVPLPRTHPLWRGVKRALRRLACLGRA